MKKNISKKSIKNARKVNLSTYKGKIVVSINKSGKVRHTLGNPDREGFSGPVRYGRVGL